MIRGCKLHCVKGSYPWEKQSVLPQTTGSTKGDNPEAKPAAQRSQPTVPPRDPEQHFQAGPPIQSIQVQTLTDDPNVQSGLTIQSIQVQTLTDDPDVQSGLSIQLQLPPVTAAATRPAEPMPQPVPKVCVTSPANALPVGCAPETAHPASQPKSKENASISKRQKVQFKKDVHCKKVHEKHTKVNAWLNDMPQSSPKPMYHHKPCKPTESNLVHPKEITPLLYTCAPPPGWAVVDGITVPPESLLKIVKGVSPNEAIWDNASRTEFFEYYGVTNYPQSDDENLGIWYCTQCYLDPSEKPPDFEACSCCLENYYFPFPPNLPRGWSCPGCKRMQRGVFPVTRQCSQCDKEEEITMRMLTQWI